jgi:hypothetical protein
MLSVSLQQSYHVCFGVAFFCQPLRRLLQGEILKDGTQTVYVLTAEYLQKWALKPESDRVGFN